MIDKKENDKMARVELNEERIDEVVGGAFNYYTNKAGQFKCVVDGIGAFYCKQGAFEAVVAYSSDVTLTAQEVTNWALANGWFSTVPF